MRKSSRRRARAHGTVANRACYVRSAVPRLGRDLDPAPDLSRQARVRLEMLDWHRAHGGNVARTARHFGYSRPTVYRWLGRFDRSRLETLEDGVPPRVDAVDRPGRSARSAPSGRSAIAIRVGARPSSRSSCAATASSCR